MKCAVYQGKKKKNQLLDVCNLWSYEFGVTYNFI